MKKSLIDQQINWFTDCFSTRRRALYWQQRSVLSWILVVFICLWILIFPLLALALLQSVCVVWACCCCLPVHAHQYLSDCCYDLLSPGSSLCMGREQGTGRGEEEGGKGRVSARAGTSCMLAFPFLMDWPMKLNTLTWHRRMCMKAYIYDQGSGHFNVFAHMQLKSG